MRRRRWLEIAGAVFLAMILTQGVMLVVGQFVSTRTSTGSLVYLAISWITFLGVLAMITLVLVPKQGGRAGSH